MKSSSASVGRLTPARPSPPRAGVRPRSSSREREPGVIVTTVLLGRDRGFAQSHRVIGSVLLTTRSRAREHDEVMRDHRDRNQALDVSMPQARQGEFPKYLAVVAEHADLPKNIPQHDEAALDIGPRLLLRRHRYLHPVWIGKIDLILKPIIEPLRLERALHAFTPGIDHLIIRQQKIDVGIPGIVIDKPVVARETIP